MAIAFKIEEKQGNQAYMDIKLLNFDSCTKHKAINQLIDLVVTAQKPCLFRAVNENCRHLIYWI